ncbi:sperm-associated antigen 17-like isoform X2 [Glandiceps talaboti]
MPPKRAKSGGSAGVSRWETGLLTTAFEEETWKASISLVVGQQLDDNSHTNILASTVAAGLRKLFSIIDKEQLYEEVKELGNPKAKRPKDIPQFFEICEVVKKHLDEEGVVPLPLLAKLLKWKLLDIKTRDLKRRDDEKKAADGKGKGKDGKGKEKRPRSKSPTKGKGKKTPEPPAPKQGTKLKKRGEEDEENKYIDDEPDDGPQHYIIITGFPQAELLALLADLGICINSIIKVESEDYSRFEKKEEEDEEVQEDKLDLELPPNEEEEAEKARIEKAKQELEKFWEIHELLLRKAQAGSKLHDVARLSYTVKDSIIPENLEDNEKKTEFGTALFEDIAVMMYDLLDAKRQYHNYLDNMKLIHVPIASGSPQMAPTGVSFGGGHKTVSEAQSGISMAPPAAAPGVLPTVSAPTEATVAQLHPPETDMRYYNEMINSVPLESISVPLIMHCMLEQVVATEEEKDLPSEIPKSPRHDGLDHNLATHISGMAMKLGLNKEDADSLKDEFEISEKKAEMEFKKPYLFHHGDDIASRLHHLQPINGFNPVEAESALLDYAPSAALREFTQPTSADIKERAARLQELLQYCASGNLSQSEINRAFKQFVLESLKLKSTSDSGRLTLGDQDEPIPWDDPYPYFKEMRQLRSEQGSRSESVSSGKLLEAILEQDDLPKESPLRPGSARPGSARPGSAKPGSAEDRDQQLSPDAAEKAGSQPGSRPGTGILRTSDSNKGVRQGSAGSIKSSVHFEKDKEGKPVLPASKDDINAETGSRPVSKPAGIDDGDQVDRSQSVASSTISFSDVAETQQRNLDDWCYAERFEPHVLLQVLEEARYLHPYMDTYYHKRDHSLLVVMHNPIGPDMKTYEPWDAQVHSDVGFRNYLEHIAESIQNWVKDEEDKYQTALREAEAAAAAATPPPPTEVDSRPSSSKSRSRSHSPKKDGKKARAKSPKGKKSASPSRSYENLDPNSGNFMRPNSMKAWKEEQDKIREEEEQKRLAKETKKSRSRSSSPKKKDEKDGKDGKGKEKERSSSRTSSRGGKDEKEKDKDKEKAQESKSLESVPEITEPQEPEKVFPFTGYDVGNDLIHASGVISTLFPSDGGQIRTERTEFIQGPVSVKTCVLKDGHTFVIHILEPKEDAIAEWEDIPDEELDSAREKADDEKSEKEDKVKEGSVHAVNTSIEAVNVTNTDDNNIAPPAQRVESPEKKADCDSLSIGSSLKEDIPIVVNGDEGNKEVKEEKKKNKPISTFGSFTAVLSDGMTLSMSNYGNQGKTKSEEKEPEIMLPPPPSPTPQPPPSPGGKGRASSGKKGKKQQQQQQLELEKQQAEQEKQEEEKPAEEQTPAEPEKPPFQHLNIACPDGLVVRYFQEHTVGIKCEGGEDSIGVLVRQHYPYKTSGKHECESTRKYPAMQEASRVINSDGTVVKVMLDGSTQVLFADGTVSYNAGTGPIRPVTGMPISRDGSPNRLGSAMSIQGSDTHSKKSMLKGAPSKLGQPSIPEKEPGSPTPMLDEKAGEWVTTTPTGERIGTKADGSKFNVKPCMTFTATDPMTKEEVLTREDRVLTVTRPDGTRIVDHNEGTRITTFYIDEDETCPDDDETGEQRPARTKRVQYVKIECVGYATVIFNRETTVARTVFGNGTYIDTKPDGTYKVLHLDGGEMNIEKDGTVVYLPSPDNNMIDMKPSIYLLRHNHPTLIQTVDPEGNTFNVRANGKTDVDKVFSIEDLYAEDEREEEKKLERTEIVTYQQYAPRFFIINEDATGTELLRHSDIVEYLTLAEGDPATAILKDSLPDYPGVTGITILKPHIGGNTQKWLNLFGEQNIIPKNLRSRDFRSMPPYEFKQPGPQFGTKVGKGLAVGSVPSSLVRGPFFQCPKTLELRQLIKYKPISEELRTRMLAGLKAYATNAKKRDEEADILAVQDPRSEEEKIHAADLELQAAVDAKLREQAEGDGTGDGTAINVEDEQAFKTREVMKDDNVKDLYEDATAPPRIPTPPPPRPKRTEADWERDRQEVEQENRNKNALKNHEVPPYFESEWGKRFLLTNQAPDMDNLTKALAVQTRKGEPESQSSTPASTHISPESGQPQESSQQSDTSETVSPQKNTVSVQQCSPSPLPQGVPTTGMTPDLRPTNPTPAKAKGQGSPTPIRPTNPTPARASNPGTVRPTHPTPTAMEGAHSGVHLPSETPSSYTSIPNYPPSTIPEQVEEPSTDRSQSGSEVPAGNEVPSAQSDLVLTRSLMTNVIGEPRTDKVRLPAAILGSKPGALSNEKYMVLEDPVRRKVYTSSVAGGVPKVPNMRGFEIVPCEVDFGNLKEGSTYSFRVHLKNVGIDSCRYKIKQPPPSTGLRVIYTPGPVAAGMKAVLELELYGIAVGVEGGNGQGSIAHHLEIITETEMLYLPITATILTAYDYDERCRNGKIPYLAPGVKVLSTRPPSREGIIRPRKDPPYQQVESSESETVVS